MAGAALLLALGLPPAPSPLGVLGGLALAALALRSLPPDEGGSRAAAGAGALLGGLHALLVLHWIPAAGYPFLGASALPVAAGGWALHAAIASLVAWAVHRAGVRGRMPFPLVFAVGWAALEWLPGWVPLIGVPWLGIAAGLVDHPSLLVPVGWLGSLGTGALVAGGVAGLVPGRFEGVWSWGRGRPKGRAWERAWTWGPAALLAGTFGLGAARAGEVPPDVGLQEVILVEIPLAADLLTAPEGRAAAAMEAVVGLPLGTEAWAEGAPAAGEIWPEAPMPGASAGEGPAARYREAVEARAHALDRPVLFGAHAQVDGRLRNVVLLADPAGRTAEVHAKRRLVPAVERSALLGAGAPGRGLAPGEPPEVFFWEGRSAGALICFEILFPREAARLRRRGATLLVQLTNDAALQGGVGPFPVVADAARRQHVAVLRLRAAELRMPAVRSAVGGRAGGWDALGRPLIERDRVEGGGAALVRVGLPPAGPLPPSAHVGPVTGPAAALGLLLLVLVAQWAAAGGGRGGQRARSGQP
jgi:apolipoprotein N-acyltransferase